MAVTISNLRYGSSGDLRQNTGSINLGTYTAKANGGTTLTPAQLGLTTVVSLQVTLPVSTTPAVRAVNYDRSAQDIYAFGDNFAEIANGTDLSTFTGEFVALGQ